MSRENRLGFVAGFALTLGLIGWMAGGAAADGKGTDTPSAACCASGDAKCCAEHADCCKGQAGAACASGCCKHDDGKACADGCCKHEDGKACAEGCCKHDSKKASSCASGCCKGGRAS